MKALATCLALLATSALSQSLICGDREAMVERLQERFGETRQSVALDHLGVMIEIFANLQTGTWSIIQTDNPDTASCLIGHGGAFALDLSENGA